jgi:hypothetical protein
MKLRPGGGRGLRTTTGLPTTTGLLITTGVAIIGVAARSAGGTAAVGYAAGGDDHSAGCRDANMRRMT